MVRLTVKTILTLACTGPSSVAAAVFYNIPLSPFHTQTFWLAVAGNLKVKLWKKELFKRDIELPGVSAGVVNDVVLESPFLVVGSRSWSGYRFTGWIKVFQLAADNLMEDLHSAASLIKTLQFSDFYARKLLCTGLVLGYLLHDKNDEELPLVLLEKTALLDTTTPPEETERNLIRLGATYHNFVDMNTTSLVFIQRVIGQENQLQDYVCKKDFWMSKAIA